MIRLLIATAVGLLLPLFGMGLLPLWERAPDTRWALLYGLLIALPLAVGTQVYGRLKRWARWTTVGATGLPPS